MEFTTKVAFWGNEKCILGVNLYERFVDWNVTKSSGRVCFGGFLSACSSSPRTVSALLSISGFRPEKTLLRPPSSYVSDSGEAWGGGGSLHHSDAPRWSSSEQKTNQPARLTNVCPAHVHPLALHQAHSKRSVCLVELAAVVSLMCSINRGFTGVGALIGPGAARL